MIEFRRIQKKFGKKLAVKDLSLTVEPGSTTMFIGPSGCGKTTTLRMINRLLEPDGGDLLIQGEPIRDLDPVQLRRKIGYAIQETGLFPHMDVYDNIAAVPRLLGWSKSRIHDRVNELLHLVTLNTSFARKYPLQLSGGEAQRVGLARALAADPTILLMDEPFGAIDPINRSRLHDLFNAIQEKIRKTIVFVTHDINEAIKLGTHIAIMDAGSLVQYDTTEAILAQPANDFVERLLGSDRNLKALILKRCGDHARRDSFLRVGPEDDRAEMERRLRETGREGAVLSGPDGAFQGLFVTSSTRKGLVFIDSPAKIDENCDLQEALNLMVSSGEVRLVVVDAQERFQGVLGLHDISAEALPGGAKEVS